MQKLDAMGLIYPSFESRAEIAALVTAREQAAGKPWPRDPDGAPLYPGDAEFAIVGRTRPAHGFGRALCVAA